MVTYRKRLYRRRKVYKKKVPLKTMVSRMINKRTETKEKLYPYNNVGGNFVNFDSVSFGTAAKAAALAAGIALGTRGDERIGRTLFLRGVYIYMAVQPGDDINYFRFMLVRNRGQFPSGSTATTVQSILSGAASGPTQWLNPIDTDAWESFYDKTLTLRYMPTSGDPSAANTKPQLRVVRKFIKINRKIEYSDNTSISPLQDLWLVAISDSSVIAHPGAVAGFVKLYYKDS